MVGDYLLALSAAEMALTPDPQIIAYYSRSLMAICEGQMAPVTVVAPLEQAREQYLYRIGCVSASLFASAAAAGGVCGGLRQDQVDALEQFGHELGLALQITADARDYTGAGRALRAGIITLPLIYAVHAGGPQLAERLDAPADDATVRATLDEVQRLGGVERARADAAAHAARARAHLASLPPGAARDALAAITDAAVS
jgi:geranylgeranyl pyrophosphate synthase